MPPRPIHEVSRHGPNSVPAGSVEETVLWLIRALGGRAPGAPEIGPPLDGRFEPASLALCRPLGARPESPAFGQALGGRFWPESPEGGQPLGGRLAPESGLCRPLCPRSMLTWRFPPGEDAGCRPRRARS